MKPLGKLILKPIKSLYYRIFDSLVFLCTITKPKAHFIESIIILRNDAIGDYLLFRDFLRILRAHYPKYHITLLGNKAYKDLSECLDCNYVDKFIWLDSAFRKRLYPSICFLRAIKSNSYEILINPIHSRDKINAILASAVYAKEKYAPKGDYINLHPKLKNKSDRIYTTLFPSKPHILFEFYRNAEFFSHFLNFKHSHTTTFDFIPRINGALFNQNLISDIGNYCVLFIGASANYRKWSIEHFSTTGAHLMRKYKYNIVICGGKEDSPNATTLESMLKDKAKNLTHHLKIINLAGKTSLTELGSLVYNGNLLISNETSCAHLGALLDTTIVIVVSNGNHLGRFIPYPKEISDKYYPVFHPFIEDNLHRYEELSNAYAYKSTLDINEIAPSKVISTIDSILDNFNKRSKNV